MRNNPEKRDPALYAHAVEFGSDYHNLTGRPLFRRTLEEYREVFEGKVNKIKQKMKDAWK